LITIVDQCRAMFFIVSRDFDNFNSIEKYKKYEADYAQRLMAKYFSKKNLYGGRYNWYISLLYLLMPPLFLHMETSTIFAGNIYEENTTIDDEIIKSSRYNRESAIHLSSFL